MATTQFDTAQVRKRLEDELRTLLRRARTIEDDLRHPLEADWAEQAIDLADDEALEGIDDVLRREVAQVRAAIARLDQGRYGICTSCGTRIDDRRLAALPTALTCIACARS